MTTSWADNAMSKQDLMVMQQDAVRRVRQMQRQARANLEKTNSFSENYDDDNEIVSETPPETIHTEQNPEIKEDINKNQNTENNFQNNNWANNRGYIGPNQNFKGPGFQNSPLNFAGLGKSPLSALTGFFTKNNDQKGSGSITDIFSNLIPKRDGNSPISKILDALDLDTEKIILIVLILLLLNDGADYTLILALGYILL